MKKYFVVGENVGGSLLPFIFNHLFKKNNINAEYIAIEKDKASFPPFLIECLSGEFSCINIAEPFSEMAKYLINDQPELQSVALVYSYENKVYGVNKALSTVNNILKEKNLINGEGKKALVLGKSRDAEDVAKSLKDLGNYDVVMVGKDDTIDYSQQYVIVINATSDSEILKKVDFSKLKGTKLAVDSIYSTEDSKFIVDAQKVNIESINGLEFFAHWIEMSLFYILDRQKLEDASYIYKVLKDITRKED